MDRQENFENVLFEETDGNNEVIEEKPKEVKEKLREAVKKPEYGESFDCPYCEDAGICGYCPRGREEARKIPRPTLYPKKKRRR